LNQKQATAIVGFVKSYIVPKIKYYLVTIINDCKYKYVNDNKYIENPIQPTELEFSEVYNPNKDEYMDEDKLNEIGKDEKDKQIKTQTIDHSINDKNISKNQTQNNMTEPNIEDNKDKINDDLYRIDENEIYRIMTYKSSTQAKMIKTVLERKLKNIVDSIENKIISKTVEVEQDPKKTQVKLSWQSIMISFG